jgi:hypothetical protein
VLLPAEIESQWLIPATRSLIAKELVNRYNFSQEDVASILGITQAAVSMYVNGNRGSNDIIRKLREDEKIMQLVNDIIYNMSENYVFTPYCMAKYIELFNYAKKSLFICKIHHTIGDRIDDGMCKICERFLLNDMHVDAKHMH